MITYTFFLKWELCLCCVITYVMVGFFSQPLFLASYCESSRSLFLSLPGNIAPPLHIMLTVTVGNMVIICPCLVTLFL